MNSLCDYCRFQQKCSLTTTNNATYDCSEYDRDLIFADINRSEMKVCAYDSSSMHKDSNLKNPLREIIISCE